MRLPDLTSPLPRNAFKDALAAGQPQIGLWLATADGYLAEMLALAAQSLAARFRQGMTAPQPSSGGY